MAEIIELIWLEETAGNGSKKNPYRAIIQLWTKRGILVASQDTLNPENSHCDLSAIIRREINYD